MKTKLTTAWSKVPSILAVLMFTSVASHAAISFTEGFSDFSPSPNMALGTGFGTPTTTFAFGAFTITSGNNSRIYLGTNAADYSTTSFVFEADVTLATTSPWSSAFIGMGSPNAGGAGIFGEPATTANIAMVLRPDRNFLESRDNGVTVNDVSTTLSLATHGISMSWNATTSVATFEFDSGNDGVYEKSFTVNGANNGFTASNSQLFIGGGNGLIFDNLTVTIIPEPSAPLLGGLGVLLLLRRRRN